ncbi:glomulin-like isoform X2 [Xiphophorus maculatus]|uniref:glomulin-like isoform X2 n=1 Tax=Xiphophorus maculatus TaxID=8083 RepID=UPI000C6EF063|nr:glomulin-like isoform X2 [Xiphophorus maculatus]
MMNEDKVHEIIQRWRETPEEDLKPEDYQQFRDVGAACLSGGDGQQLLKFIQDEKNQGIVKSMGCGLLAPLVDKLVTNKKSHDHCQAAFTQLIMTCSSTTLLQSFLELIEGMDPGAISETILVLLPHLQTVLLQLDENRAAGVGLALSALHKQLSRLPVPYTQQQEEADEHGLCCCCVALATFTRPFVDGVKKKDENCNPTPEDDELKAEILKLCVSVSVIFLCTHPSKKNKTKKKTAYFTGRALCKHGMSLFLDLVSVTDFIFLVDDTRTDDLIGVFVFSCMLSLKEPLLEAELNRDRKSTLWLFAVEIMIILSAIRESLPGLLFFSSLRKFTTMDTDLSKESAACLAYLLFVQLIAMDTFPAVFNPVFILQCNMEHISQLLSRKKESHLLKGLALFAKSLEKVEDNSLPVGVLDLESFYSAPQNLRQVLTDCPIQHLRESGLKVFQLFINKLDAEAKHKFFRCMLKTSHHAGVEGYIVNNIRSQIQSTIKGEANKWFLGTELLPLLELVLSLPQAAETDLLTNMDKDKELKSDADVWEELCRIKDEYLKMLRVCISMSRAYYSAEMKALKEEQKLKAKEVKEQARSTRLLKTITVKHDKVSHMSPEVQYQVLQSALVTFDLMESLVVRIDEITEEKQGKPH